MDSMIRVGRYRRFTMNRTFHLDIGAHRLFAKVNPNPVEAAAEVAGYHRIRHHYRLPRLHSQHRVGHWTLTLYDRHQPDLPDTGLLLDALTSTGPGSAANLDCGLDATFQHYRRTIDATICRVPASRASSKLYRDRAQPGGRLDHYYGHNPILLKLTDADGLRPSELRKTTLMVNGEPRRLDLPALVSELRDAFHPDEQVWAAMTQGDPTDFNIGLDADNQPVWFDYDTAGLNALPGEIACFLWYQRLHGAWLVPHYNTDAYADHRKALAEAVEPTVRLRRLSPRAVGIDYQHQPSPARQQAITRYLTTLARPLALSTATDLLTWIRPYLAMRILAVYPLQLLEPRDAALSLGLLADLYAPDADLEQILGLTTQTPAEPPS
ncbi:hypothetical protein [Micromonospora sp. S-DT3-3-22]|uniref:hypothetical protein n=1 Tax=Micromonospora sp. S-DT3-3-22 TaxID=2755359 RepID=UPI00188E9EE2|nr:hypothetical protein [Micromonospora sp. S-DT3-3-22]